MKFHEDRCKGYENGMKTILPNRVYSNPCIVTLNFDLLTRKSIGRIPESIGVCM